MLFLIEQGIAYHPIDLMVMVINLCEHPILPWMSIHLVKAISSCFVDCQLLLSHVVLFLLLKLTFVLLVFKFHFLYLLGVVQFDYCFQKSSYCYFSLKSMKRLIRYSGAVLMLDIPVDLTLIISERVLEIQGYLGLNKLIHLHDFSPKALEI